MFLETKRDFEVRTRELEPWRQLLLDAADTIERVGHCKHMQQDDQGRMCYVGALRFHATGNANNTDDLPPAAQMAHRAMQKLVGRWPVDWNNAVERTAEEVIATMRTCALGSPNA